ncbi:MAG: nitroreductase family protein [candidate division WOR-3 bacterium]|nr:nitroreductase family protein [candidate division WOR-3 bacterium]
MDVKEAILKRRAYRSLKEVEISEELIKDLAECASLAPSCFNNQPWRFVFVYDKEIQKKLHTALNPGNEWAYSSSMIIAVFSKKELDCQIKGRDYYLFDTGMAVAFLMLRATELGLVAHPIAGYNEEKVKEILNIPKDMQVITLIIVGEKSEEINKTLTEKQIEFEYKRPERLPLEKFVYFNEYKKNGEQ